MHNVYSLILFLFSLYVYGATLTYRASGFSSRELATIVDHPWRMEMGGFLMEELLSV
jgi:hypothetical protein